MSKMIRLSDASVKQEIIEVTIVPRTGGCPTPIMARWGRGWGRGGGRCSAAVERISRGLYKEVVA
jgi:hypothetical protein